MLRDFSEESKQQLLNLVNEVDAEKRSNFTDWWGDRWYDFESYIGKLDIGKYIDNVNVYHKKVIDKNNATEKAIKEIYEKVEAVDKTYYTNFSDIDDQLRDWKQYICDLQTIVDPKKNNLNAKYIGDALSDKLKNLEKQYVKYLADEKKREPSYWDKFKEEFADGFGLGEVLDGTKNIKDIYGAVELFKDGLDWKDGFKVWKYLAKAAKIKENYDKYAKIGRAVGKKVSTKWWIKDATGLKSVGRVSTAKNPLTRFVNNLKNKTSPYNFVKEMKDVGDDFLGKNGKITAVASWATVLLSGITNYQDNIKEQKESGGSMSTGRVWTETITETTVDVVSTFVLAPVVGAAVAAVSPFAMTGVVAGLVGSVVVVGVDAGIKAVTGQSAKEWIADGASWVAGKVGSGVKKTTKAVGKWFKNLVT